MSISVTLRYKGKEYTFVDNYDYQPWFHSDGTIARSAFEVAEYMYTEGNYGCDCNRSAFLADDCDVDFKGVDGAICEYDEWSLPCGREIRLTRLNDVEYVYDETLGLEIPATEKATRDKRVELEQSASGLYLPKAVSI